MAAIRKLASRADVIHMSLMRLLGKHPNPLEHIAGDVAYSNKKNQMILCIYAFRMQKILIITLFHPLSTSEICRNAYKVVY